MFFKIVLTAKDTSHVLEYNWEVILVMLRTGNCHHQEEVTPSTNWVDFQYCTEPAG